MDHKLFKLVPLIKYQFPLIFATLFYFSQTLADEKTIHSSIHEETQKTINPEEENEIGKWEILLKLEPTNSNFNYQLAGLLIKKGDYTQAIYHLKKALESRPDNVDARLRLSYIYLWEGKYAEAEKGFEEVLKQVPNYTDAKTGLEKAQTQLRNIEIEHNPKEIIAKPSKENESEDTLEELEQLVREHPDISDYQYRLGTIYVKDHKYTEATQHLQKALELDPKNADALLRLSYIYLWEKNTKTAIEGFEKVLKDHPDYTDAKTGLIKAEELEASLEKSKRKKRSEKEKIRIDYARELEKKQLLGEAFSMWYGLYLDYPNDPEYTYNTGKVASWIGKWNLGKKLLCNSLNEKPYRIDALIWLGNIYLQINKWAPAYAVLCTATHEAPKRGEAWLTLGRLEFKTRKFKAAKKSFYKSYNFFEDLEEKGIARRELVDTRIITDPSFRFTERYGQELEKDLQTKREAARRYSWLNEGRFQCALTSQSIAYQEVEAGYEREKNLAADKNNFYAHTYRSTTGIDWFYNPYYKFSVGCTVRKGNNEGHPIFPFRNRVVGQPWVNGIYRNVKHVASCGFLTDSFIYKNFQKNYSAFLLRNTVNGLYQYQNFPFGQYLGISGYYRKYKDAIRNDERRGSVWMQTAFPRFQEHWILRYQFDIGGFRRTDTDYYSFKSQWEHFAKILYWNSWYCLDYFEISYQRSWRSTRDLNQPINTVFFLPKQFIHTNRVTLILRKVLKPNIDSNLEGLYYWDTAGYKAIAFRADVRWIF